MNLRAERAGSLMSPPRCTHECECFLSIFDGKAAPQCLQPQEKGTLRRIFFEKALRGAYIEAGFFLKRRSEARFFLDFLKRRSDRLYQAGRKAILISDSEHQRTCPRCGQVHKDLRAACRTQREKCSFWVGCNPTRCTICNSKYRESIKSLYSL